MHYGALRTAPSDEL